MSSFPEITSLFAALASNLQTQDPSAANELDLSISNLNRSLNLSQAPSVRILDTALSLMCFTAPQVYDSTVEFAVRTIVAVLCASIECKALRMNDDEQVLRIGGSIPKSDCVDFMDRCAADIFRKLDGLNKGDLCALLLYNVIRVAALAPCFPREMSSLSSLKMKSSTSALANVVDYLPKEFTLKNGNIPLRLLLWHLDPMILKEDILQILREITERPFLSLNIEIYDRIEWRSKLICLVLSPSMFIETRAFLHNWFLTTGSPFIMELQTEFVGQVLDIISRPMWWGISIEVGSKLPFSQAYFPYEHDLLRILAGPISPGHFQHLLRKINDSISHAGRRKTGTKINLVDHKSVWAMVMNFPGWLSFASMLLFSKSIPSLMQEFESTCTAGAAEFIAWIMNPTSESNQQLAIDYLVKVSDLWNLNFSGSDKYNGVKGVHKDSSRLKLPDKGGVTSRELDSRAVSLWLKEFNDIYVKLFGTKVGFSTSTIKGTLLFRRIPLGILLVCPNNLSSAGCSLLLHFAATGNIQKFSDVKISKMSSKRWKYDLQGDSLSWIETYTKAEAIAGCKTVFDITDRAENISHSMFETEDEGLNFVCQMKLKACNYLVKCVKRLLQIKFDGDGPKMQRDLLSRIIRWRRQGKDVFQNEKDLDCVCDALNI